MLFQAVQVIEIDPAHIPTYVTHQPERPLETLVDIHPETTHELVDLIIEIHPDDFDFFPFTNLF